MPANIESAGNFLIHDWAKGDILYNQVSPDLFKKMLSWCEKTVWVLAPNSNISNVTCDKFYKKKTLERLDQFRVKHSEWSECCTVNGIDVDTIDHYVESIDWDWLCNTTEWRFIHGDLHFDNTIYDPFTDKFTAIDWRTDFAGDM
jgi:aminoglycoside phosphotransferase (APT) family kinase protein